MEMLVFILTNGINLKNTRKDKKQDFIKSANIKKEIDLHLNEMLGLI